MGLGGPVPPGGGGDVLTPGPPGGGAPLNAGGRSLRLGGGGALGPGASGGVSRLSSGALGRGRGGCGGGGGLKHSVCVRALTVESSSRPKADRGSQPGARMLGLYVMYSCRGREHAGLVRVTYV